MQPSGARRKRLVATFAVSAGLVLVAAAGLYAATALSGPSYEKKGSLHCIEDGEYLYTFDAVWRIESLRHVDPSTGVASAVAHPDAEKLSRMRSDLLRKLKVERLEAVPEEGKAELSAIRALGYI